MQFVNENAEENDLPITERLSLQKVSFRLICEKTYHRRMRSMNHAIKDSFSLGKIVDAANNMEEKKKVDDTRVADDDDDDDDLSPTLTRYADFEDEVKAQRNEENVTLLLNSILNNLKFLKSDDERLKTNESRDKIKKIKDFVDKLPNVLG